MPNKINSRGVTLVEVLISLVVLLIVFMGLIQASILSIDHNLRNEVRDEASRIAASTMDSVKILPFDNLNTFYLQTVLFPPNVPINRSFRNMIQPYDVTVTASSLDENDVQITVIVGYIYHGEPAVNITMNSLVSRS